jgi:magnesium transporter
MIENIRNNTLTWYHILNPSDSDISFLQENFSFHPLDLEDLRSKTQRPKLDEYDDYYFMILHFPIFDKAQRFVRTSEVKVFWGKDYLITIANSHWVVRNLFISAKENDNTREEMMSKSSDILLYEILDRLLLESFALVTRLGEEVELINSELFRKKAERTIERISVTRRNIIILDTIIKPQLRLFHKFESGDVKGYAEDMEEYWGDILDKYQKIWDLTEDFEEIVEGLSKTFDSLQTNRTNEIMKVLTLISSILLPLTLIASIYGMNIDLPFMKHPNAFWIVTSSMGMIVLGLVIYFKRKNYM